MTPTEQEVAGFIPEVVDHLLAQYAAIDADQETIIDNIVQEFALKTRPVITASKS